MSTTFAALVIADADGKPKATFKPLTLTLILAGPPDHDAGAEIACSSLSDKDGTMMAGIARVGRRPERAPRILAGEAKGRIVIDMTR